MVRRVAILFFAAGWLVLSLTPVGADAGQVAVGHVEVGRAELGQVEVIEVGGILDDARLNFLLGAIEAAAGEEREVVILQLNAPAVTGDIDLLERTARFLADPPLPLV
ncbi:MAG TPA: hypothetical protein VLA54_00885, partial [Acidimicrobiia bacterium]|nr:hypothetical protein [Acidimicrobiia bacterium]